MEGKSSSTDWDRVGYEACHIVMRKTPDGGSGDLVVAQSVTLRMNVTLGKLLLITLPPIPVKSTD